MLKEVAARLRTCVRDSDTVARLGGDEFVLLLPALGDAKYAATVAQKILAVIAGPFTLIGQEFRITTSIGISTYPQDGLDEQTLTKNADIAMYQAKEEGKNNFQFYSERLNANSLERLTLESSLRHALERGEFRLHYQAKRDIVSGRITGMEALLRWQHPDLGTVAPMQLIPIAEETGLIIALGRSVLTRACEQAAVWQRRFDVPLQVLVKVSARQIADRLFPADVADIVTRSGLRHGTLGLEVTESVLLAGAGSTATVLTQLVDAGVRLILADFGTGYASLTNLTEFPLAGLRIDRSLTNGIGRSPADPAIVKAVIDLCRALGLTVVADGVDSEQQLSQLCLAGCTQAQGHLFSRAQAASATSEYLADLLL